jgi:hypothetical protein
MIQFDMHEYMGDLNPRQPIGGVTSWVASGNGWWNMDADHYQISIIWDKSLTLNSHVIMPYDEMLTTVGKIAKHLRLRKRGAALCWQPRVNGNWGNAPAIIVYEI